MAPGLLTGDDGSPILKDPSNGYNAELKVLCQILTPIGMVGYGFDEVLNRAALQKLAINDIPTALILDSGSTDSGPDKLALGTMTMPRSNYERDIRKLLALGHEFKVPVIISSAGGSGIDSHVDEFLDIIHDICQEAGNNQYKFKTLAIYSNISKAKVLQSLNANEVTGCGISVPPLTENDVEEAVEIVAQMGPESFVDAMHGEPDFDILIGGRAYDPSPYIAYCAYLANPQSPSLATFKRQQLGGYAFMGKIMECGALCSTPKSASALATVYVDGTFDIQPLSPDSRCIPSSVAAHALYEKARPDILPGPGGNLDLTRSKYDQLPDGRSVRVSGAEFYLSRSTDLPYTVKLEAAKIVGYRTMMMGGIRDPILISQIDKFLPGVKEYVSQQHKDVVGEWQLKFHVYGVNGIMGSLEPGDGSHKPREIFIVGEALASTQTLANSVASTARIGCVHGPYPGQRGTGGNLAMGVGGKLTLEMGPCTEFCIYHLIPLQNGQEGASRIKHQEDQIVRLEQQMEPGRALFSWKMIQIGKGERSQVSHNRNAAVVEQHNISEHPIPTRAEKRPEVTTVLPTILNLTNPRTLCDIAPVVRSKNSGPYDITLDVLFSNSDIYNFVKKSNFLTRATIANLYHLREDEIVYCGFYDPAMAFKATLPRKRGDNMVPSGGFMEADVHASQQYVGLLEMELSEEVKVGMKALDMSGLR